LPGYRGLEEIGGSAIATVYRAIEAETGRPVALKVLAVDSIPPHLMETFAQNVQALAEVSDHPNIVTLYRSLTTPDGRPVLVLELCRESMAERIRRRGPMGASDVTRVGVKIAGALETAHRQGFLHRDITPQNILVTQFGEPVLGDFDMAALQTSAPAGELGFDILHAAPEILEGNHLSPATDVYGLASTMYQLLTGLAPFASFANEAPASVILRIIRDPVRPLRADDIPISLSDLLESALAKDPQDRPRRAAAFADALTAVEVGAGWVPTAHVARGDNPPSSTSTAGSPSAVMSSSPASSTAGGPLPASPPATDAGSWLTGEPDSAPPSPSQVSGGVPSVGAAELAAGRLAAPVRPALAPPVATARHVVTPGRPRRGPASPHEWPGDRPPLAPLRPAPEAGTQGSPPSTSRPVFVDPPAADAAPSAPAGRSESGDDAAVWRGAEANFGAPDPDRIPNRLQPLMASPLMLGGLAAAGVVVIAALLLTLGVL
jgi:serine/threonine protein kinase